MSLSSIAIIGHETWYNLLSGFLDERPRASINRKISGASQKNQNDHKSSYIKLLSNCSDGQQSRLIFFLPYHWTKSNVQIEFSTSKHSFFHSFQSINRCDALLCKALSASRHLWSKECEPSYGEAFAQHHPTDLLHVLTIGGVCRHAICSLPPPSPPLPPASTPRPNSVSLVLPSLAPLTWCT